MLSNFACGWLLPSDEGRWLSECEAGRVATTFLTAHVTESVDELVSTHKAIVVAVHNKPFANVTGWFETEFIRSSIFYHHVLWVAKPETFYYSFVRLESHPSAPSTGSGQASEASGTFPHPREWAAGLVFQQPKTSQGNELFAASLRTWQQSIRNVTGWFETGSFSSLIFRLVHKFWERRRINKPPKSFRARQEILHWSPLGFVRTFWMATSPFNQTTPVVLRTRNSELGTLNSELWTNPDISFIQVHPMEHHLSLTLHRPFLATRLSFLLFLKGLH